MVAAKVLDQDGFEVTVFEREAELGGVWARSRSYPGLRANTPREMYAFSDHAYPPGTDDFPKAGQIRKYLDSYVERFDLRHRLRFSTEVASVRRMPEHGAGAAPFRVRVRPAGRHDRKRTTGESLCFDRVAVCSGVFSEPFIPSITGRERFRGTVIHSSRFTDPGDLHGKRVVVVGAGKSALDCASAVAHGGGECTLVVRTPNWMVPRYFFGSVRMDRLFATRFAEIIQPPYHRPGRWTARLHRWARPLLRAWWAAQTRLIPRLSRMPPSMVPATPLPGGLEKSGVGTEFYRFLQEGHVRVERGSVAAFLSERTLRLDSGRELEADQVVLATGWRQDLWFLDRELRRAVLKDGRLHLYRGILPPRARDLGFIGAASSTACPLTSEMGAHWLSHVFQKKVELPSVEGMEAEVARVHRWLSATFPARDEGHFIGPYVAHYVDELLEDMGLRTRRAQNPVAEYLSPLWPSRYRGVAAERRGEPFRWGS